MERTKRGSRMRDTHGARGSGKGEKMEERGKGYARGKREWKGQERGAKNKGMQLW